jgi:hypothetical protein
MGSGQLELEICEDVAIVFHILGNRIHCFIYFFGADKVIVVCCRLEPSEVFPSSNK